MRAFMSVVLGIAVCFVMLAASWLFSKDTANGGQRSSRTDDALLAVVFGALVGAINYFVPMFYGNIAFLAPISLAVMVFMTCYLMYWWAQEGSNFREMLPMIALVVMFRFTTKAAAVMTVAMLEDYFLTSLLLIVPEIVLVLALGFFVTNLFYFRYREAGHRQIDRILAIAAGVITALIIFFFLCTKVYWNGFSELMANAMRPPEINQEVDAEVEEGEDFAEDVGQYQTTISTKRGTIPFSGAVGYYNLSLQVDDDPSNNFDFGFNPLVEGGTAEDYDLDLRTRAAQDPALASSIMAWWDAKTGTRFTGRFYETCKGQWADTINMARDEFVADPDVYYGALVPFYRMMDEAKVSIRMGYNLNDQMYMNPYTSTGVPDIIVMKTDQDGIFLVYTITIKGNAFEVPYRINCGYQPTNVQEVMHIEPQPEPQPQPNPQPNPQPGNDPNPQTDPQPGNGDNPPQPNPPSGPVKKPKDSTTVNTQPNDDPSPSTSTNNGVGATTSTADQPTNSNHGSNSDYNKAIGDLKDTNATQKTGSDSNTPSTPAPTPSTHVDNNGDKGNGGAPINTPTTVTPPATVADTGQAISDSPGEAWGGPAD